MIDTHAHLDFENFDFDREQMLSRFFLENKGLAILNIGVDFESNLKSVELADSHRLIFASVGFHPEILDQLGESFSLKKVKIQLQKLSKEKKVVAIGEIGLDYFHNSKNKEQQKDLFILQLSFAQKQKLPVIIHCRDAYEDVYKIISSEKYRDLKMVMHCYGGDKMQTQKFLQLKNLFFSFTGNITFPKKTEAEIFEVIAMIPLKKIMAETDCPFLAPAPMRGKRNEPVFVKFVIEKIAELKKSETKKTEEILDENARDFFGFKL